jgi:hypothetical protein
MPGGVSRRGSQDLVAAAKIEVGRRTFLGGELYGREVDLARNVLELVEQARADTLPYVNRLHR